ncbi:MAG: DNA mismatch repair endonuclease MutL [Eubacteriaceae bacterium]|jgi:DNA mismatch repair protein MutL|nr:DNA mismatch repair endonuclease MutL [Eubacteriaceae bacterium]
MNRIKLLDEKTSSLIAAGEVVVNPAAAVKELIENAFDANSKNVEAEIQSGGKALICVMDDGDGIAPEDLKLAFLRNATSKILDSVEAVETLGFRGEALASIAAVSRVRAVSVQKGAHLGRVILLEAGNIVAMDDAAIQQGTKIEVRNLFYNLPARLKNLRKNALEAQETVEIASILALSRPNVSVRMLVDGKESFHTDGSGSYFSAAAAVLGNRFVSSAINVDYKEDPLKVMGLLVSPPFIKGFRHRVLVLNGRAIQSQAFGKAIDDAYEEVCGKRGASFLLYVDLPYRQVDVNIHPSKQNVRLFNETLVLMLVRQGLKDALGKQFVPRETFLKPEPIFSSPKHSASASFEQAKPYMPASPQIGRREGALAREEAAQYETLPAGKEADIVGDDLYASRSDQKKDEIGRETLCALPYMKFIGNAFGLYALLESGDEIYAVDTHAAHERVLYEEYLHAFRKGDLPVQALLAPLAIFLSPPLYQLAVSCIPLFASVGYEIGDLGEGCIALRSVPASLALEGLESAFPSLIDDLAKGPSALGEGERSEFLIKKACHNAVRGDEDISHKELVLLLNALQKTDMPFTCPHGRPILSKIHKRAFMRSFERIR